MFFGQLNLLVVVRISVSSDKFHLCCELRRTCGKMQKDDTFTYSVSWMLFKWFYKEVILLRFFREIIYIGFETGPGKRITVNGETSSTILKLLSVVKLYVIQVGHG